MRVMIWSIVNVSVFDPDHDFKSALQTAGVGFGSGAAINPDATTKTKNVNESVLMSFLPEIRVTNNANTSPRYSKQVRTATRR